MTKTKNGCKLGEEGLHIDDEAEFPLSHFPVPICYQEDLSNVLIPHGLIQDRILQLAHEIHRQIGDRVSNHWTLISFQPLTMLCVLKGSFRFSSDLLKCLSEVRSQCSSPIQVEFIRAQSYQDQASTGQLRIEGMEALGHGQRIRGKQVLLVDDIIDTGLTLSKLATELAAFVGDQGRVWTALLVSKRTPLRRPDACHGDFVAFSIPDKFIVGYGMDYNQYFRDLSHICVMNQKGIDKYKLTE